MIWLSTRVEIGTITAPMCSRLGLRSWAGGGWSASDGLFEPHTLGGMGGGQRDRAGLLSLGDLAEGGRGSQYLPAQELDELDRVVLDPRGDQLLAVRRRPLVVGDIAGLSQDRLGLDGPEPATHLRVHSAPENAPGDALGGPALRVGDRPGNDDVARGAAMDHIDIKVGSS